MLPSSLAQVSSNSGNSCSNSYLAIKWKHRPTTIAVRRAQLGCTNMILELNYGYVRGVIESGTSPFENRPLLGELMAFSLPMSLCHEDLDACFGKHM